MPDNDAESKDLLIHQPAPRLDRFSFDGWGFSAAAVAASPFKPIAALHLGSFGFDTPDFVREAAKAALDRPECNQYSPCNGRKSLRDALAEKYTTFLGRKVDPELNVLISTGAIEGILSAITAFVHPGDEVLIFEPFYDQFVNNVKFVGGIVKLVPLQPPKETPNFAVPSKDWQVSLENLEAARSSKTKMLIMNSPHNPLGKVFSREELQAIGNFCVKYNILIISDEVYEHLSYTPFTRMASISPEIARLTLTVGSAGKAFFLTGWRVGWVIGHQDLIKHVTRAHISICFSTVSPFQEAVADALVSKECETFWTQTAREMAERGKHFNQIWEKLGLRYIDGEGGYFTIVDMSPLCIPDEHAIPSQYKSLPYDCHIVWFLTTVIGVAAIPCSIFTTPEYQGLSKAAVRFGFGRKMEELDLAKERLLALGQYLRT